MSFCTFLDIAVILPMTLKHHITARDAQAANDWRREGGGVGADGAPQAQHSAYLDRLAAKLRKQRAQAGQRPAAADVRRPPEDLATPLSQVSDAEMHERARRIEAALKKLVTAKKRGAAAIL